MTEKITVYPSNNALHFRPGPRGVSVYNNNVLVGVLTRDESLELGEFLVATAGVAPGWPQLPAGVTGTQVRYTRHIAGVRLGDSEPKVIVTETDKWVIFRVYASTGELLNEVAQLRWEFDTEFERREI